MSTSDIEAELARIENQWDLDGTPEVPKLIAALRAVLAVDHWCEGGNGVGDPYEACSFDAVRNALVVALAGPLKK